MLNRLFFILLGLLTATTLCAQTDTAHYKQIDASSAVAIAGRDVATIQQLLHLSNDSTVALQQAMQAFYTNLYQLNNEVLTPDARKLRVQALQVQKEADLQRLLTIAQYNRYHAALTERQNKMQQQRALFEQQHHNP